MHWSDLKRSSGGTGSEPCRPARPQPLRAGPAAPCCPCPQPLQAKARVRGKKFMPQRKLRLSMYYRGTLGALDPEVLLAGGYCRGSAAAVPPCFERAALVPPLLCHVQGGSPVWLPLCYPVWLPLISCQAKGAHTPPSAAGAEQRDGYQLPA